MEQLKKDFNNSNIIYINSNLNQSQIDEIFNIESALIYENTDINAIIKSCRRNNKIEKLFNNNNCYTVYLMISLYEFGDNYNPYFTYLKSALYENNVKLIIFDLTYKFNSSLIHLSDLVMSISTNKITIFKNTYDNNRIIKYNESY